MGAVIASVIFSHSLSAESNPSRQEAIQREFETPFPNIEFLNDRDESEANYWRGYMYFTGRGVSQNYHKALEFYNRSADQGHVGAQTVLGVIYSDGLGVEQDYLRAAQFYRRAAERGHAPAEYNLGYLHFTGRGVPQDYGIAAKFFRRAAEKGDADAQTNLGAMYTRGHGVPRDYVKAHMWFSLAAAQGKPQASRNRDIVAKKMTQEQLSQSKGLAREQRANE